MAGFFTIRNWSKYQHYRDRKPPWVKLHRDLITSEDWASASDATRVLLVTCMLLASQSDDGTIPNNPRHVQRIAYLNDLPDFGPLVESGFLVPDADASAVLADCKRDASRMLPSCSRMLDSENREQRTETEINNIGSYNKSPQNDTSEKPKKRTGPRQMPREHAPDGEVLFVSFWKQYPRKVQKKDAQKAWAKLDPSAEDARSILAALEQDKRTKQWTDERGRFVPYPASWLNGRRWEDEQDADGNARPGCEATAGTAKAPEDFGPLAKARITRWAEQRGVPESGISELVEAEREAFSGRQSREIVLARLLLESKTPEELKAAIAAEQIQQGGQESENRISA